MIRFIIHLLLIVTLTAALTACGDNVTGYLEETNDVWPALSPQEGQKIPRKCISGDDFGYPKFTVHAKPDNPADILGEQENQVVVWEKSGYEVFAPQLLIGTSGRWTSWFGDISAGIAPYTRLCTLQYDSSANACPEIRQQDNSLTSGGSSAYMLANDPSFNAPCWFTHGYGAYMLFAGPDSNPNGGIPPSINTIRNPTAPTLHLFGDNYDPVTARPYYGDSYLDVPAGVSIARTIQNVDYPGSIIWSKILDRFYGDNSGSYVVKLKLGARIPGDGPIESLIKLVRNMLFDAAEEMYENIIANPDFQAVVWGFLTLYIIISAMAYLYGFAKVSQADLVWRIIKIAIIAQLLSAESWDWFNFYLFGPFIYGVNDLICIVINAAVPGLCYGGMGITVFDTLLHQFTSPETQAKASAALFYGSGAGIVYVIMIYAAILVFLLMLVKTLFAFLIAYIPTAVLIVIAPFFICFMLFERTKHLFQGWLKEMFSYAMQSFLAMAMLGLVTAIIMEMLHKTIGYRICWKCLWCPVWNIFGVDIIPFGGSWYDPDGIRYYQMDVRYSEASLAVTEAQFAANPLYYESLYPGHMGYMYMDADRTLPGLERVFRNPIDLPYLDPILDYQEIRSRIRGNLVSFGTILAFIIVIWVAYLYAHKVGEVAQEISGGMRGVNVAGMAFGDARLGGSSNGLAYDAVSTAVGKTLSVARDGIARPIAKAAKTPFQTSKSGLQNKMDKYSGNNAEEYNKAHDGLSGKEIRDLARAKYAGVSGDHIKGFDSVFGERPSVSNRKGFDKGLSDILDKYRDVNKSSLITDDMRNMTSEQLQKRHGVKSLDEFLAKKRSSPEGKKELGKEIADLTDRHFKRGMTSAQRDEFIQNVHEVLDKNDAFSKEEASSSLSSEPTGGLDKPQQGGGPESEYREDMTEPPSLTLDDDDLGRESETDDRLTLEDEDGFDRGETDTDDRLTLDDADELGRESGTDDDLDLDLDLDQPDQGDVDSLFGDPFEDLGPERDTPAGTLAAPEGLSLAGQEQASDTVGSRTSTAAPKPKGKKAQTPHRPVQDEDANLDKEATTPQPGQVPVDDTTFRADRDKARAEREQRERERQREQDKERQKVQQKQELKAQMQAKGQELEQAESALKELQATLDRDGAGHGHTMKVKVAEARVRKIRAELNAINDSFSGLS